MWDHHESSTRRELTGSFSVWKDVHFQGTQSPISLGTGQRRGHPCPKSPWSIGMDTSAFLCWPAVGCNGMPGAKASWKTSNTFSLHWNTEVWPHWLFLKASQSRAFEKPIPVPVPVALLHKLNTKSCPNRPFLRSAEAPAQHISSHVNYSLTGGIVAERYGCSFQGRTPAMYLRTRKACLCRVEVKKKKVFKQLSKFITASKHH